jgi:hypothetical protein
VMKPITAGLLSVGTPAKIGNYRGARGKVGAVGVAK